MNWKRVVGWSLLLLVAASVIGFISGFIMVQSEIDPENFEQTANNYRLARRVVIAFVAILCYWRLGAGASRYRGAHIAAAFVLVQSIDIGITLLLGAQLAEVLDPWGLVRAAVYALLGYALARLRPNNSFKPTPLRGAA
jgi:hypothetical protein